jgi:hypothetical protein
VMHNNAVNFPKTQRVFGVLAAALLMAWPAFYNRYPLLYPDTTSYLTSGRVVGRAIFLHQFSDYYGERSLIYGLGILPFHWNITPWPIVFLNAVLTAYVLWLTARSLLQWRPQAGYWSLVMLLSLLTGLGWIVGRIMPDVLGPVLYLSIYLIVFSWDALRRAERVALLLIAWWAITSHATHLLVAGGLCVLLVPVLMLQREPARVWLRAVGRPALIVMAAVATQLALNAYLYGKPSLNGPRPPFLLARIIADGPGRWYLQSRCGVRHFAVCGKVQALPDNTDDFLWTEDGIWRTASEDQQERMIEEEMPVVLGALRAYPRDELLISTGSFWQQLHTFGLEDYDPSPWIAKTLETALPGSGAGYAKSRQAQETLNTDFFTSVQEWTVAASLLAICVWSVLLRRNRSSRLIGFAAVIAFSVLANAAVTGVLSNVEDRYQARVIWLVPLLAGVLVLTWLEQRASSERVPGKCAASKSQELSER